MSDKIPNQERISELWEATKKYVEAHSGGGTEYTAGDGIAIDDGTINVTNPNRGVLTKEEFDLLTPEQQKSGTYIVDDGGEEVMVVANIHSTEEQIIGQWIDGRPIYRKTFQFTSTSSTGTLQRVHEVPGIDILVCAYGSISRTTSSIVAIPNVDAGLYADSDFLCLYLNASGKNYTNKPCVAIFEYTKTTDAPTSNLLPPSDVQIATSEPPMQKSGTIVKDGVEYDYEFKQDVFGYASATGVATSVASSVREAFA